MRTLEDIRQQWLQSLGGFYPDREISSLLRFAMEDLFGWSYAEQLVRKEEALQPELIIQLETTLKRLQTGEPLQYITGFTWFDELKIRVSPAVLIPRPETEELVHWIIESAGDNFNGTIIDWCTGSGCIALALKNRLPKTTIIGYDLSAEALEMARINAEELELKVVLETKDALAGEAGQRADIIVSNPPYIPEKDAAEMHRNVLDHEPRMALFVPDDDALLFYRAITDKAIRSLNPGGMLFFELHEGYAEETKAMILATGHFQSVEIRNDLQGKPRMLKAFL